MTVVSVVCHVTRNVNWYWYFQGWVKSCSDWFCCRHDNDDQAGLLSWLLWMDLSSRGSHCCSCCVSCQNRFLYCLSQSISKFDVLKVIERRACCSCLRWQRRRSTIALVSFTSQQTMYLHQGIRLRYVLLILVSCMHSVWSNWINS